MRAKFYQIIWRLTELLKNANNDKHFFLHEIKFLGFLFLDLDMWDIYKSSLSLLKMIDFSSYCIALFNLKLDIEEMHEVKVRNLKEFEIHRLGKKQDIDTVVIEGYCNSCNSFFIICIKIIDYWEYYVKSLQNQYDNDDFKCKNCNKDYLDFHVIVDS